MSQGIEADLERVRAWARGKLANGEEPPWAWYQYMKLVEAIDFLRAGRSVTKPLQDSAGSPESGSQPENDLRPPAEVVSLDSSPRRRSTKRPQLPT